MREKEEKILRWGKFREEFATAVIVAEYENGKNQYTITFNKSMQLTGFFVK